MGRSSNNKTNKKKISKSGGAHNGGWSRSLKTKHRTKDLDQIQEELAKHAASAASSSSSSTIRKFDQDLPGGGQYYCMTCARYFITQKVMDDHLTSKIHKKRVKLAAEKPYSQEEANMAAGLGPSVKRSEVAASAASSSEMN